MRYSDTLKQYALITVSCALYALGFCWCCQPQHMSIGGLTGVAQVLNVFFPALPVGTVTLVLNVPVFIWGGSCWAARCSSARCTPWPSAR